MRSADADHLAVSCGDLRLTYRELDERVERLARALPHWELGRGVRLAILARHCHRVLETQMAVVRCGAVLLPLEPSWSAAEAAHVLIETRARALFISEEFLPQLEQIGREAPGLNVLPVVLTDWPPPGLLAYERLLELRETAVVLRREAVR
jgi:acyl-CoA synthetase (AMP-forming)/AMP-acid ligase II